MTQFTDAPIFDADQHMYETPDALTKYLPERYRKAVQFVQIGRHTRIAIMDKITDYIPNPTFERVAAPARTRSSTPAQNTEGLTMREMPGAAIDAPAATRNPADRIAELDRQGVRRGAELPDAGQPRRALRGRGSRADDGDHPRAEPVDARALELQPTTTGCSRRRCINLRRSRRRPARTRVHPGQRRQGRADQTGTGQGFSRLALARAAGVRPVLARRRGRGSADRAARQPAAAGRSTSASGNRRTPTASWRERRSGGWCWATARSPT